jgi:hypothetical protein
MVCLLSVGCSSSRVFQTSGSSERVLAISDVEVVQSSVLSGEAESSYRQNSMSGAIREALLNELRRKGKLDPSGATIKFAATDFRLRSGVAVAWIGVMAGDDYLSGTIIVKRGDAVLKSFEASAKSSDSAWSATATGHLSSNSRADLFCRMIAKKIVTQL